MVLCMSDDCHVLARKGGFIGLIGLPKASARQRWEQSGPLYSGTWSQYAESLRVL